MNERSYLSIGDVLSLLREEFPDITISKIRFLESRGLLIPERTPSGYRKFYDHDVDRLRWILRQQRENFLPLKVIKGRLEGQEPSSEPTPMFEVGGPAEPPLEPVFAGQPANGSYAHADEAASAGVASVARSGHASALSGVTPATRHAGGAGAITPRPSFESAGEEAEGRRTAEAVAMVGSSGQATRAHRVAAVAPPSHVPAGAARGRGGAGEAAVVVADIAASPTATERTAESARSSEPVPARASGSSGAGEPGHKPAGAGRPAVGGASDPSGRAAVAGDPTAGEPGPAPAAAEKGGRTPEPQLSPRDASALAGASLTAAELGHASGLDVRQVEELESYGLIESHMVAGVRCYDEEALVVAGLAAGFARFGVEARHLRMFKHAAERQAGLYSQIVMPLLRQRNPDARRRAHDDLTRLTDLGASMQACFAKAVLRDLTRG